MFVMGTLVLAPRNLIVALFRQTVVRAANEQVRIAVPGVKLRGWIRLPDGCKRITTIDERIDPAANRFEHGNKFHDIAI